MKRTGIFVGIVVVIGTLMTTGLTASGRLWWRTSRYQILVNGTSARTMTYAGRHVILVKMGTNERESYVVYPMRHQLGLAVDRRFVPLPGCVLSLDESATYIPIGKSEVPVMTKFADDSVTFQGIKGEVITIIWVNRGQTE